MRFSTITLIISAATATNAAVLPNFERTAVASNEFQVAGEILDSPLEKRVIIEGILTTIATTALTELTTQGVKAGIQLVKDIASFDSVSFSHSLPSEIQKAPELINVITGTTSFYQRNCR